MLQILISILLILIFPTFSIANSATTDNGDLQLGLAAILQENIFLNNDETGGKSTDLYVPAIAYKGHRLKLRGLYASYSLIPDIKIVDFGVDAKISGITYSNDNIAIRRPNIYGGVYARLLFLSLGFSSSVTSKTAGTFSEAFIAYPIRLFENRWTIMPRVGIQTVDKNYSNHYFGVDADEAIEFAQHSFSGNNSVSYLSLSNSFTLTQELKFRLIITHKTFDKKIEQSPIVEKKTQRQAVIMLLMSY